MATTGAAPSELAGQPPGSPLSIPDDAIDLLRQLVAGQREIITLLERQQRPAPGLTRDDRALLSKLLPAIGATFGSELFNSAEVCDHPSPALRLVLAGLNAKQLGRLLRRAAGTPIDGHLVERLGVEAGAILWRVVEVPEFPRNQKISVPHASSRDRA